MDFCQYAQKLTVVAGLAVATLNIAGCTTNPMGTTPGGAKMFCKDDNALGLDYPNGKQFIVNFTNGGNDYAQITALETVPGGQISFTTHYFDDKIALSSSSIGGVAYPSSSDIQISSPYIATPAPAFLAADAHIAEAEASSELFTFGIPVKQAPTSSSQSCANYINGSFFVQPDNTRILNGAPDIYAQPQGYYAPPQPYYPPQPSYGSQRYYGNTPRSYYDQSRGGDYGYQQGDNYNRRQRGDDNQQQRGYGPQQGNYGPPQQLEPQYPPSNGAPPYRGPYPPQGPQN